MWNKDVKPEVVSAISELLFRDLSGFARDKMLYFEFAKTAEGGFEISAVRDAFKAILDGARAEGEALASVNFSSSDEASEIGVIPEDLEILRNFAFGGVDTEFGKVCAISYSDPGREVEKFIDRYMRGEAHGSTIAIDLVRYIPGEENKPGAKILEEITNLCRRKLGDAATFRDPIYSVIPPGGSWLEPARSDRIMLRIKKTPEEIRETAYYKNRDIRTMSALPAAKAVVDDPSLGKGVGMVRGGGGTGSGN